MDKQNEAFLWLFLIVIVFAIVLLNLYLRQRLKINKELKKLKGEKEFYNSIFLEEDSFYIHIDEQYYISQIEKLIEISGVTGEYVKSMELYAILSVKYTEIEQDEYERIILLFEKFRFGGKTLRDYELYVLECFKNKFIKLLYKKSKIHKKLILRYKYLL